jgi:uncharacterized protein YoxC
MDGPMSTENGPAHAVNGLAPAVNGLAPAVNGLVHAVNGLARAVNGLARAVNGLAHAVNGLARVVNGLARAVNGLAGTVNGLARAVNGLARVVNGLTRTANGVTSVLIRSDHAVICPALAVIRPHDTERSAEDGFKRGYTDPEPCGNGLDSRLRSDHSKKLTAWRERRFCHPRMLLLGGDACDQSSSSDGLTRRARAIRRRTM